MVTTNKLSFVLITLPLLSGLGAAQTPPAAIQPTQAQASVSPQLDRGPLQNFPISSGDLLDVETFSTPELSGRFRVDQEGFITLPVGGTLKVEGLLPSQAAGIIKQYLISNKFMLNPSVTVDLVEYAVEGVTVLGEVKVPGVYTLLGPRSLYDALAAAGGVTASEGSTITVTRANDSKHPIVVNVTTPNYSAEQKATIVIPGDTIVVNRAPLVYVVGDVVRSGAFFIQGGTKLSILNLLSLAQGANRTAAMSRASVIRPMPDGTAKTIRFDLNKVMKNEAPNFALQADDVLVLPRSGLKSFGITALPALTNAVTNAITLSLVN